MNRYPLVLLFAACTSLAAFVAVARPLVAEADLLVEDLAVLGVLEGETLVSARAATDLARVALAALEAAVDAGESEEAQAALYGEVRTAVRDVLEILAPFFLPRDGPAIAAARTGPLTEYRVRYESLRRRTDG